MTVVIEPGNRAHADANPTAWSDYRRYLATVPGPTIVVVQDLDGDATRGAFFGEVNSAIHRAFGCVGTVIDGAIRDLDEMNGVGFKAIGKRLCVGHAWSTPVRWNCPVEVFGLRIEPGQLVHADKHGVLAVPRDCEAGLLDASRFMDGNECATLIRAAKAAIGQAPDAVCASIDAAASEFGRRARERFGRSGEWR